SRENLRASRSLEAFSGSSPRRASERRNMRSSSSAIWAVAFSWVKPMVSRSETPPAAGLTGAFSLAAGFSSSKTPSAFSAFWAAGAWADAHGTGRAAHSVMNSPARRKARRRECGLGLAVIEHLLRTRLSGVLGGLEHLLLDLDDLGNLVNDVDEALPLRHL